MLSPLGKDWRGYCAATSSGPEKSRQMRQTSSEAACLALMASICLTDGLEDEGIGGGAASGFPDGRFGIGGGAPSLSEFPFGRLGIGGGASSSSRNPRIGTLARGRVGSDGAWLGRDGNAGRDDSSSSCRVILGMAGDDRVEVKFAQADLALSSVCSLFDGGKGGSAASSRRGGSFLVEIVSIDDALDLLPIYENADCVEWVDLNESFEACRASDCSEGRLAGSGGKLSDCCEPFREGSGGGFFKFRSDNRGFRSFSSRSSGGGGNISFSTAGSLPAFLLNVAPFGTVLLRKSFRGRDGFGAGGGGGRFPTGTTAPLCPCPAWSAACDCFKAAIR